MTHSSSSSDGSDTDTGHKEIAAASGANAVETMRSPVQRKDNRSKSVKAKATAAKSPKKLAPLPPRALNAYNIFFREERKRWIDQRNESNKGVEGPESTTTTPAFPPFAQMGKIIGQKWKELPTDEKLKFESLAKEDMQRYRKEVDDYKSKLIQETEKSAEALGEDTVSSAWNYRSITSEENAEIDLKREASPLPQLILPTRNRPADALPHNSNVAGASLPQSEYSFLDPNPSLSQIHSQTQMHNLLHQVVHQSQDASMIDYSQQQQQQLLALLLPRATLQQSQHEQQLNALRQHQLQNDQHELLLLQLANSYLPRDTNALSLALGGSHPSLSHPSLGLLHNSFPSSDPLLPSQHWYSTLQPQTHFSADLDRQLRISALLRQQHLAQLANQEREEGGTKPPSPPPPGRY